MTKHYNSSLVSLIMPITILYCPSFFFVTTLSHICYAPCYFLLNPPPCGSMYLVLSVYVCSVAHPSATRRLSRPPAQSMFHLHTLPQLLLSILPHLTHPPHTHSLHPSFLLSTTERSPSLSILFCCSHSNPSVYLQSSADGYCALPVWLHPSSPSFSCF